MGDFRVLLDMLVGCYARITAVSGGREYAVEALVCAVTKRHLVLLGTQRHYRIELADVKAVRL